MELNCLITGVGGQGTVLASKIIAQTAINLGYAVRTSETIGMAQRGGAVVSHVRIGPYMCPIIPHGKADIIIGFEPAETVRAFEYLKPQGNIIVCSKAVMPVTSALAVGSYKPEQMLKYLKKKSKNVTIVDGDNLSAQAGTAKTLNIMLLGVAMAKGILPFSKEDFEKTIKTNLAENFWEMNLKALKIGYNSLV